MINAEGVEVGVEPLRHRPDHERHHRGVQHGRGGPDTGSVHECRPRVPLRETDQRDDGHSEEIGWDHDRSHADD